MRSPAVRAVVHAALLPLAFMCATASAAGAAGRPCWDCDIPFQWDNGASLPPEIGPFPQGFALTVPVAPGQVAQAPLATLERYADVAVALGRCWATALHPEDARWRDVTLRVSFKRDGTVNGMARVSHVSGADNDEAGRRGTTSLLAALPRCTPLPFSPSLGRAIAGQVFAIRFVQQRNS